MTVTLDRVECCSCLRCLVLTAGDRAVWRSDAHRAEAVAIAALRCGWLYYTSTGAWACKTCVAKSDTSSSAYRAAVSRMAERVRRALSP